MLRIWTAGSPVQRLRMCKWHCSYVWSPEASHNSTFTVSDTPATLISNSRIRTPIVGEYFSHTRLSRWPPRKLLKVVLPDDLGPWSKKLFQERNEYWEEIMGIYPPPRFLSSALWWIFLVDGPTATLCCCFWSLRLFFPIMKFSMWTPRFDVVFVPAARMKFFWTHFKNHYPRWGIQFFVKWLLI